MLRSLSNLRLIFPITAKQKPCHAISTAGYKSQYSIDKVYPNSNADFASNPSFSPKLTDKDDEFSGVIPIDKLDVTYSRSGGPGGQNVNKVNTKVQIRFNIEKADWIPTWIKPKLFEKEKSRITKDGDFLVASDKTRKQLLNHADCMDKIRAAIRQASVRPAEPTEEDIALKNKNIAKAKSRTLKEKRAHSQKKQNRQTTGVEGF